MWNLTWATVLSWRLAQGADLGVLGWPGLKLRTNPVGQALVVWP
jgi:hypothetical protein